MNSHEYQAKELLEKYNIPVPPWRVASNKEQVTQAIEELNLDQAVLKVQVHAGGRGKAGGVKIAKNRDEIYQQADQLMGMQIVNNQTGPAGLISHNILIGPLADIAKEYYVGVIMDREKATSTLIVSPEGGMDIEEVAAKTPEKIMTEKIALDGTLKCFQLMNLVKFMGWWWSPELAKQGMAIFRALAQAFTDSDASILEINPLILTQDVKLEALDAKLSIDDNALFRQEELAKYYDPKQQSKHEIAAKEHDLAYIALDGDIGCMVNGAGLAMATMDIINHFGGKPANFLDVGGGASKEKVTQAFKIILSDSNVKAILVNIFGGIMNCDTIAQGIIEAINNLGITVPLIVRLEGTNVDQGKQRLDNSKLNIISAESLADAAQKAVASLN